MPTVREIVARKAADARLQERVDLERQLEAARLREAAAAGQSAGNTDAIPEEQKTDGGVILP